MAYPETIGFGRTAQTLMMPNPQVIDSTTEEYSIDEQRLLLAQRFKTIDRFSFLVRPATAEGVVADDLFEMTIEPFDAGHYPDAEVIADVRRQLRERDGYPVTELLAEIEQKQQETITDSAPGGEQKNRPDKNKHQRKKSKNGHAILKDSGDTAHEPTDLPLPGTGAKRTPTFWTPRSPQSPPRRA